VSATHLGDGVSPVRANGAGGYTADLVDCTFLQIMNAYRASKGLGALKLSPTLGAAARYHSSENMERDVISHDLADGTTPRENMADHDYPTDGTSTGEIIYRGRGSRDGIHLASAQAAFNWWKNSPGHNALMLSSKYRAAGIGRAYDANESERTYWTVDFGGVVDSSVTCNVPDCGSSGYVCYDWDKRAKATCSSGRCQCAARSMAAVICRTSSGTAFATVCCQSSKSSCASTATRNVKNRTIRTRYSGATLNGVTCK
jgi:hypothetical protein